MAECFQFVCSSCGFSVQAWDDGNPYIQFPGLRKRHYFYHPSGEQMVLEIGRKHFGREPNSAEVDQMHREWGGNASEHLCRECGAIRRLDPHKDRIQCSKCKSAHVVDILSISGMRCIRCEGTFLEGTGIAVS